MRTWWLVLISRSRSDSATTGLGNSGYQSIGPVGGQDQRPVVHGPFADQLVEVVGLGGGVLAQPEVVEDQHGGRVYSRTRAPVLILDDFALRERAAQADDLYELISGAGRAPPAAHPRLGRR